MRKRTKKVFLGVAGGIATFALGMAFVGCNKPDPIVLTDFEDIKVEAALDDSYTLPIGNVTDTQDNDYQVTFQVKTQSGKNVSVSNNTFWLKSFEDYYILCTADLGGGEVRTRTITIEVQDKGAPEISFGAVKRGIVGEEYALPETTVQDSSKETLTARLKVFELNGEEKGDEIDAEDGTFVPERMGYYLIEAQATDSNGNTGTATAKVYVREAAEANEIVSFKYAEDIECVGWSQKNGNIEWLESYEGEQGVAKFSYTSTYWANGFSVLPLQDVSENSSLYPKYDTLIVRMYIKNDAENTNYFTDMTITDDMDDDVKETQKAYQTKTALAYNQWVDFQFSVNAVSAWDNESLDVYYDKLWGRGVKLTDGETELSHKGEFYVAGIFLANKVDVTATADKYSVGSEVTFSVKTADPAATYQIVKPDGTIQTLSGNKYTIADKGVHTVRVTGKDYYGETQFKATRAYGETELMSFDDAEDIASVATSDKGKATWLESYEGETGVLKFDWEGNKWPTFAVSFVQGKAVYETYKYVVVRVYAPTEGLDNFAIQSGYNAENKNQNYYSTAGNVPVDGGQWVDIKFGISALAKWVDGATAEEALTARNVFWCTFANNATQGTVYIADISLSNE